jgi:hypothetical protein
MTEGFRFHTGCVVPTLGLSLESAFFLVNALVGGDAEDGPNVNERDNEDANTDPNPDPPLRGWECWSGDAAIGTLWLIAFRSAAIAPRASRDRWRCSG